MSELCKIIDWNSHKLWIEPVGKPITPNGYSHVDTEIIFREIDRPYKIEVEKPVIEYITLPCNPVTKNAQ